MDYIFWNFAGEVLFGVILLLIAANRRQFKKMMRSNPAAVLYVNGANELINLGGILGVRYTLLFLPLGIVQAISSTTSFFVLFFGVVLSLFFPKLGREELGFANLMQKITAISLVVAGVLLINLY
ncbi:MAG: hypothetical protein LUQ38_11030 [Methanotrichaceae archaeon]|nr:hypothetical protein [Methanotrichaceae archaeon]